MPVLKRPEPFTGRTLLFYDGDDPARLVREEQATSNAAAECPSDGLMGAGFVEETLDHLLR